MNNYITHIMNNYLVMTICLLMAIPFFVEFISIFRKPFKDCKSVIVSIGIFGTFLGIFLGLWNFDVDKIDDSVPDLLKGLKTAFLTSIIGLFTSIILSFLEIIFKPQDESEESKIDNLIKSINSFIQIYKPTNLDSLIKSVNGISEIQKNFFEEQKRENNDNKAREELKIKISKSALQNQNMIITEQKEIKEKTDLIYKTIIKSSEESTKAINERLDIINKSLKEAFEILSKGATEKIIEALKDVIKDFNENLTEQFGENFKELNDSVKRMIVWQDNYKNAIEQIERNLKNVVTHIEITSASMEKCKESYEKISETSEDLRSIIEANENQIRNLETHIKNLAKIGEESALIVKSINDFSDSIKNSLSGQSEGLRRLNEALKKDLEESLGSLNKTLTSLTEKFGEDYQANLEHFKKLLNHFYKENKNT